MFELKIKINKWELVLAVLFLGIRRAKPTEGYKRGQKMQVTMSGRHKKVI